MHFVEQRPSICIPVVFLSLLLLLLQPVTVNARDQRGAKDAAAIVDVTNLPLVFEPAADGGHVASGFVSRRNGIHSQFSSSAITFSLPSVRHKSLPLTLRLSNANPSTALAGEQELASRSNYLIGSDPAKWRTHVSNFGRLRYASLYPGVDLIFYGTARDLEHDFVLAPWANPRKIAFTLKGARNVRIAGNGDLRVELGGGTLTFKRPVAYQMTAAGRRAVSASFIRSGRRISFKVGTYDRSRELVIDPVLSFGTYLDGTGEEFIHAVTTDSAGNIYVSGQTASKDFPIVNAPQTNCKACQNAYDNPNVFVSKLDPTGHTLIYSTYLGGSFEDEGYAISVDSAGRAVVAGIAHSSDFPHVGSLFSPGQGIEGDFLASLRTDGSAFNFAGVFAGWQLYTANPSVMTDPSGNIYVTGDTDDPAFPITGGTLTTSVPSGNNAFVMKLGSMGAIVYATLIPKTVYNPPSGQDTTQRPVGISVDGSGNILIAGNAGPGLPTTAGVIGPTFVSSTGALSETNGFVLKLNASASSIVFATYVPGTGTVRALAADGNGNSYLTGALGVANLPVTANAYQRTVSLSSTCYCDFGYVLELDAAGQLVLNATYLTGTPISDNFSSGFNSIALDKNSNVFVAGLTHSADFPLLNPLQSDIGPDALSGQGVIAELTPDLSGLLFGSFLGGTDIGSLAAVTIDKDNNPIVAGSTFSADFPSTPNSYQPVAPTAYAYRAFVAKVDVSAAAPSACFSSNNISFPTTLVNTSSSQDVTLTNCGNASLTVTSVSSSAAAITATQSCGTIAPGGTCPIHVVFSPTYANSPNGGTAFSTLTVVDNASIPSQHIRVQSAVGIPQVFYPPSMSLPDLVLGTQAEEQLALFNNGTGNWIVSQVTATGDFTADNKCTAPVAPNAYCTIGVLFAPSQAGQRSGVLTVYDNTQASPNTITLSGNGLTTYPPPAIRHIPAIATGEQQPSMTVLGSDFFPMSQVYWNGTARPTHYQDEGTLYVELTAQDIAQIGEASVTVSNPTPGGGTSGAVTATIYSFSSNISFLHTVFEPHSALLYGTVSATSKSYPGLLIAYDPATMAVVNSWNIGNKPNQLAVSDDGQFLYVGLDGDAKVAQLSLPSGTINFSVGLGNAPLFGTPMIADALAVLPGSPHSWAVTLCGSNFSPCGQGVAVFDDAIERPTVVSVNQVQPDSVLFVGSDTSTLYGTTLLESPSTFYTFAVSSSGITQQKALQSFTGNSPGGGQLDTDGKLIYVSNGQIIDPTTLNVTFNNFGNSGYLPAMKVDAPASRIYFAGQATGGFNNTGLTAYDLSSKDPIGSVTLGSGPAYQSQIFRWGSNGIGISSQSGLFLFKTSLVTSGPPTPVATLSTSGLTFSAQLVGSVAPAQTVTVTNRGNGDLVISGISASGDFSETNNCSTLAVGAGCTISVGFTPNAAGTRTGTLTINDNATGSPQQVSLTGTGTTPGTVTLSTPKLTFNSQLVGSSSGAQGIDVTNSGDQAVTISGITVSGDFSQTNNCSTLVAGAKCTVMVVFTPTTTGPDSGSIAIADNASGSPQTAQLAGTGADFGVSGSNGSSQPSATVQAGATATYNLTLNPTGAFAGIVSFSCAGAPTNASCTVSPSQVDASSGTPQAVTVSVNTNSPASHSGLVVPALIETRVAIAFAAVMPGLLFVLGNCRASRSAMLRSASRAGLLSMLLLFALLHLACGGGGNGASTQSPPPPTNNFTPAGTYTLTVNAVQGTVMRSIQLKLVVQ